jgi:predicted DNA-binding transcriptional regulator YafY
MREQAAAMRERLYVDATDWRPVSEDLSMLPAVQDAVARDCRLSFDYERANGERGPRVVEPLGLVVKGMSWYLVARTPRGMRTYRLSRMRSVTPLAIAFERPARFHLESYWKHSVAELQAKRRHYEVRLLVSPQSKESLIRWCAATPVDSNCAISGMEGWVVMHADFECEEHALHVALSLGSRARILAPTDLCERVRGEVLAMAAASEHRMPAASSRIG